MTPLNDSLWKQSSEQNIYLQWILSFNLSLCSIPSHWLSRGPTNRRWWLIYQSSSQSLLASYLHLDARNIYQFPLFFRPLCHLNFQTSKEEETIQIFRQKIRYQVLTTTKSYINNRISYVYLRVNRSTWNVGWKTKKIVKSCKYTSPTTI